MDIDQIYARFETPLNLREHMRRVAEVVKTIIEGWKEDFPEKEEIVTAALVHDIAKPVSFDPDKQPLYITDKNELSMTIEMIKRLRAKYGESEHQALHTICKEAGMSQKVTDLAMKVEWSDLPQLMKNNDISPLILIYADMRVSPKGIIPLEERLEDLVRREPGKKAEIEGLKMSALALEKRLQMLTKADLKSW